MSTPRIEYRQTREDDKWVYGEYYYNDEFMSHWLQLKPEAQALIAAENRRALQSIKEEGTREH